MEPQKYYEFENGVYCVHFSNKQGLSIEAITNIFSEFGKVSGVTTAGDAFGYRFVRYRREEEVLRCVEALRNHPTIKLRLKDPNLKKNKNQTNNNKVSSFSYGQKTSENNEQRTEFQDNKNRQTFEVLAAEKKPQYTNNNIPATDSKNYSAEEQKKNEAQGVMKKAEDLETKVKKLQEIQSTNFEACKPAAPLRQPEVSAESFMPVYAKTNCTDNVTTPRNIKPSNISLRIERNLKLNALGNKPVIAARNLDASVPLVQSDVDHPVQPDVTAEEIPRLVMKSFDCSTPENNRGPKSPQAAAVAMPATVTAEEVVVANIHTDFGVHYILHLIQKHDPLSVSEMKIVPSLGLRYCIVYLQSLQQAHAIEKELDNFKLSGKDLIVLRPRTLAELSASV